MFQELLSHSSDRPEKQQLKEALEAMQVQQTRGWTDSPASWGRQLSVRARVCGLLFDGIHPLVHSKLTAGSSSAEFGRKMPIKSRFSLSRALQGSSLASLVCSEVTLFSTS